MYEFTQRPKETNVALRPATSISLSSGQRTAKEFTQRPKEANVALRPTTSISLSSGQRTAKEFRFGFRHIALCWLVVSMSSTASAQDSTTTWSAALSPTGCIDTEGLAAHLIVDMQSTIPWPIQAGDAVDWKTLEPWFDLELGLILAADYETDADPSEGFHDSVVLRGEALKRFVVESYWLFEFADPKHCLHQYCRIEGRHKYTSVAVLARSDGSPFIAGLFEGDGLVVEYREKEVDESEREWKRRIEEHFSTDVSDHVKQAKLVRAFGAGRTALALLEEAVAQAPNDFEARRDLAILVFDPDDVEAIARTEALIAPLACAPSPRALEALGAVMSVTTSHSEMPGSLVPYFAELLAAPPTEPLQIPVYVERFAGLPDFVRQFLEGMPVVIDCPKEYWRAQVTDNDLSACTLRWALASELVQTASEINRFGAELVPSEYPAVSSFYDGMECDVLVMSKSSPGQVVAIVKRFDEDDLEHLNPVIDFAVSEAARAYLLAR